MKEFKDSQGVTNFEQRFEVFAIFDMKAERYGQPFLAQNTEVAVRSFRHSVNNPESQANSYPEDFVLFRLAKWSDITGEYENELSPVSVVSAFSLINRPKLDNSCPSVLSSVQ